MGTGRRRIGSATRPGHDLTDAQFALVAPLLPPPRSGGRPRFTDPRRVLDGVLYLLRTGCPWRMLPREYPPWGTVWCYFRRWRIDSVWHRIHEALRRVTRERAGRDPEPSAAIVDSQSVRTAERGARVDSMPARESTGASATYWWTAPAY